MHAHCGILREHVLRAAQACFGHRLMMDRVVPGGVADDLDPDGAMRIRETCCSESGAVSAPDRALRQYRLAAGPHRGTGIVRAELAQQFGAAGYVGRASGRDFDARQHARLPAL